MSLFRKMAAWLFVPVGAMVGWAVHGQTMGMTVLCCVLFGFACTVLGCWLAVTYVRILREQEVAVALQNLREQYQIALQRQAANMKKALIALSACALRSAAEKMVQEFLPQFNNEEQFEAALRRTTDIVNAELDELVEIIDNG